MTRKILRKSSDLALIETKSGEIIEEKSVGTLDLVLGAISWGEPSRSGVLISEKAAIGLAPVLAACRIIAEAVASATLIVLDETRAADGRRFAKQTVVREHWAATLAERPNEWQTQFEFIEWHVFNALLFGSSLSLPTVVRGEVRELIPVPNGSWDLEDQRTPDSRVRITMANGTVEYRHRTECLLLPGPSLDAVSALRPVRELREMVGLMAALEIQQAATARAGGRPSGILAAPQGTKPAEIEKVNEGWAERFGVGGKGGTPVLNGDWKYTAIGQNAGEQQTLQTREFLVREVARAYNLPAYKLGATGTTTFASAEAASRDFYQGTISPWHNRFEQALNRDILRPRGRKATARLRYEFDERALTRGTPQEQSEYYTKALGAGGQGGWMTVNEIRAEQSLPEIDEPWANTVSRGAMDKPAPEADAPDRLHLPSDKEAGAK